MTLDIVRIKDEIYGVLGDHSLVNEYIRHHGPLIDDKSIALFKEEKARQRRRREEQTDQGQDPIFTIKMICPVCNQNDLIAYEMRAKSQQVLQNKFLVPIYKGAFGYRSVDYNLLAVTVCPRCLFASPDKKDFTRPANGIAPEVKTALSSNLIISLQEHISERKKILYGKSDFASYFERPRIDQAAIDSYRLAIARAKTEIMYELPYAYYKLGAYTLRIAKIMKDGGTDTTEILTKGLTYLEEAFRTSNCPSEEIEIQVIYTIIALAAKLGDHKKAKVYTSVFKNLYGNNRAREKQPITENTAPAALIKIWDDKIERLSDSASDADFFKDE